MFFAVKPLTLIDNRSILYRTHHIDLRRKNIGSDHELAAFLVPDTYCTASASVSHCFYDVLPLYMSHAYAMYVNCNML